MGTKIQKKMHILQILQEKMRRYKKKLKKRRK